MPGITVIWSAACGACLALAGLHLATWLHDRKKWASFWFSISCLGVVLLAACEVGMMRSTTPELYGRFLRWIHIPAFLIILATTLFIRLYLGAGRVWLAAVILGLRLLTLVVNFAIEPNLNYVQIKSLRTVQFMGETVSVVGEAVPRAWMWVAQTCFLLWLVYAVDAAVTLWRRNEAEDRRRAVVVAGGMSVFILLAAGQTILTLNQVVAWPLFPSIFYLLMALSQGSELSRDVLRAARLAHALRTTERRLNLAANSAGAALWEWDLRHDRIWASSMGRALFGLSPDEPLSFQRFLQIVHPEDRAMLQGRLEEALKDHQPYSVEYRILLPDGKLKWISGSGNLERDPQDKPLLMRGVSMDITDRKANEAALNELRNDLTHLSRVTTLGELSSSLAHELSQPLGAMLANAQAAERLLANDPANVGEVREILADISSDGRRGAEVIHRLRGLLQRGELVLQEVDMNEIVREVRQLMRQDLLRRQVKVSLELAEKLPPVPGDRIQLQQVLLNLLLNASEALAGQPPSERRVTIRSAPAKSGVLITVSDEGSGLPDDLERVFEPFYTTKSQGLGIGLSICRSIVRAHQGRLWAEHNSPRGASFHLSLPVQCQAQ